MEIKALAKEIEDEQERGGDQKPISDDDEKPIWGARAIAVIAGLGHDDKAERKAWRLLEAGLLRGRKAGRLWVSNRRDIRNVAKVSA